MTQRPATKEAAAKILARLDTMTTQELKRYLVQELTRKKLGLVWETDQIERDRALNGNLVLPKIDKSASVLNEQECSANLIIEGDNFDALRLLKATHPGKIRVIYIDPPYNTGNRDWVYNDDYVKKDDRWKHSTWLEFMYQRLCLARDLLTTDGVILISINDENRSRLELLMDEVMPGRRLGSMVWRTRQGSNADQGCFLSVDHEHILVYGNPGFAFAGFEKTYDMYSNPDNDPRGDWQSGDLTLGFTHKERPNLYYPLVDPNTDIHYPPNPDGIWRYASEARLKPGQRLQAKSMEEFIRLGQILFPKEQEVGQWDTLKDLLSAIDNEQVPRVGKSLLLRRDLPNIEQWVGKKIGFGRPRFKRYKADLKNQTQPLSSWVVPTFEQGTYDAEANLVSATNVEGARQVSAVFGDRVFNYAKPASLISGLLEQATRPNDIVLDFFAGSGTTAHAVLALNAEDGGSRRFILCSSTEATAKEPEKNLCRDVCAKRVQRVIQGYGKTAGVRGDFAYLRLDLIEEADLMFDADAEHAYGLLCLRETGVARTAPENSTIWPVDIHEGAATVVCPRYSAELVDQLAALGVKRLVVYTDRPDSLADQWEQCGHARVALQVYSLETALKWAQLARTSVNADVNDMHEHTSAGQEAQA